MKRHNPKVVDPNINPSTSTPLKPKTPKLARERRKKVDPRKPRTESTCKRKRNPKRKLEFDGECSTMETRYGLSEVKTRYGLSEVKPPYIWKKKRRNMRHKRSPAKLAALIRLASERLKGECSYATSQLDKKKSLRSLKVKSMQVLGKNVRSSDSNTKIQQDNVFLIQGCEFLKLITLQLNLFFHFLWN